MEVLGEFSDSGLCLGTGTGIEKGEVLGLSCGGRRGGGLEVGKVSGRRYGFSEMVGCVSGCRRVGVFVVNDKSGDDDDGGEDGVCEG